LRRGDGVAEDDYRGLEEGVVGWGGGVVEFEAKTLFGWEGDVEGEGLVEVPEVWERAGVVVADGEAAVFGLSDYVHENAGEMLLCRTLSF
jgi:hypothetical protein